MASFDEIVDKTVETIEKAKPVVEGAISAGAEKATELAEKADDWASSDHPNVDKAFEALSGVADGVVNAVADGADIAYEFIKNKAEEASKRDIDGDGFIGNPTEAATEASADAAEGAEAEDVELGRKVKSTAKAVAERISNTDIDGDGEIG